MKQSRLFRLLAVLAVLLCTIGMQAQDAISVHYKGAHPTISDFVTAFVSSRDLADDDDCCSDESFNAMGYVWDQHLKGIPMGENQTLTVDEKNGYVLYESSYEYESVVDLLRIEMCYWNEADGKHKLFAYSVWCFRNGKPALGQFDGLSFYRYDNATKMMTRCDPPGFEVKYYNTSYELPRTGKDIIVTTWDDGGKKEDRTLKWNGHRFGF